MKKDTKSILLDLIVEDLCMQQLFHKFRKMGFITQQEVSIKGW